METNRNDLIYGQNWVNQAMRFRDLYGFNHFYESTYHHVLGIMNSMGEYRHGYIYRHRAHAFLDGNAVRNYVLVR